MEKSYAFCPVSVSRINERVVRFNAAFTVVLLLVFTLTGNIVPLIFLIAEFFLRAFELSRFSPFTLSSKGIVHILGLRPHLINAGPKLFAARIGLVLSMLILASALLSLHLVALTLAAVLALFSFLESVFGFCVACEIYPFVYRFLYGQGD
jgi:hypothetical protein